MHGNEAQHMRCLCIGQWSTCGRFRVSIRIFNRLGQASEDIYYFKMSYINSKRELKHGTQTWKQCNEETCLTSDKIKITERWI